MTDRRGADIRPSAPRRNRGEQLPRLDVTDDEVELITDALRVFEQKLRRLGTRNSGRVANKTKSLYGEIERGERIK